MAPRRFVNDLKQIVADNIDRRQVQGNGRASAPMIDRHANEGADLVDDKTCDIPDQDAILGDGNELTGRNIAQRRGAPADERFKTDDFTLPVDLGLIDQTELSVFQRSNDTELNFNTATNLLGIRFISV